MGFDWNGNGSSDAFDHYMDMTVMAEADSDSEGAEGGGYSGSKSANCSKNEITGISMGGKPLYDATKDSSGVTILKSLLVVALCIGGIALPVAAEMEGIAVALFPLGAVGLGVLILKNT